MQKRLQNRCRAFVLLSLLILLSALACSQQPPKKLYFAHAVNSYGTEFEKQALEAIKYRFPNYKVENPNQPHHQAGYNKYAKRAKESNTKHKGMNYFFDEVLPKTNGVVIMPYLDGKWGLGVAGEAIWALKRGLPVWIIYWMGGEISIRPIFEHETFLLLFDQPSFVLSHEETRLRTWKIYYRVMRPFDKAHMVKMPIPEGFYPEN